MYESIITAAILLTTLTATAMAPADVQARSVSDTEAPRALPGNSNSPVQVSWTDTAHFTDIRQSRNLWEVQRDDWIVTFASYVQKTALTYLSPGQKLQITITDIKRPATTS